MPLLRGAFVFLALRHLTAGSAWLTAPNVRCSKTRFDVLYFIGRCPTLERLTTFALSFFGVGEDLFAASG